ncbi:MAG: inorganic pyrophosphatase [Bacteroidia bacterium]|nr:inorganic pyrophosphatase [Bacteroidia bacterium]
MNNEDYNALTKKLDLRYKVHPWHGIEIGSEAPEIVTAFIEIVPADTVKYEIDKVTGYLKVDRPQKFSNIIPALYGFIPKTYCDELVANYCIEKIGRPGLHGDKDPLDICVLSERNITHGDLLLKAIPIGGFRMLDQGEVDDKIIAVMKTDEVYSQWKDIDDIPPSIIARLKHYFLTYKIMPGVESSGCEITDVYNKAEAHRVIELANKDYKNKYEK